MNKIDAVIKVGGSLFSDQYILLKLLKFIKKISSRYHLLIIPGGGEFADLVRKIYERFNLSDFVADRMAILSMDQYGLILSDIANLTTTYNLNKLSQKKVTIFLPSRYFFRYNPLKNTWQVTSDSIAAYISQKVGAKKLILVKDVNGIYSSDPKINKNAKLISKISPRNLSKMKNTCVDEYLPKLLIGTKLSCYVVNGKYPKRIVETLEGKLKIGTLID